MLLVVDTNVCASACLGRGASAAVIEACLESLHQPLMGAALLAEYEDVMSRKALFSRSRLSAVERSELLDIFLAACRWTRIYYGWRPNSRDEGDNHLVELAVAGGASHIVTFNLRDFRTADLRFPDIGTVTPAQFLKSEALS